MGGVAAGDGVPGVPVAGVVDEAGVPVGPVGVPPGVLEAVALGEAEGRAVGDGGGGVSSGSVAGGGGS